MSANLHWRAMTPADLVDVMAIASVVHPDYPEDMAVFAERLALAPIGCRILCQTNEVLGYVLSHPWSFGQLPELNNLLGAIPQKSNTWYLHDLALLPAVRGTGAAGALVKELIYQAKLQGFSYMTLVAVNGSAGFWERNGFRKVNDGSLDRKLASYDKEACYMHLRLDP
ncbi:MAG: GNAT family N-acetyltransferase [Beijerinckiaceae bacterium]